MVPDRGDLLAMPTIGVYPRGFLRSPPILPRRAVPPASPVRLGRRQRVRHSRGGGHCGPGGMGVLRRGLRAGRPNGKVTQIEGDPDSPVSRAACARNARSAYNSPQGRLGSTRRDTGARSVKTGKILTWTRDGQDRRPGRVRPGHMPPWEPQERVLATANPAGRTNRFGDTGGCQGQGT